MQRQITMSVGVAFAPGQPCETQRGFPSPLSGLGAIIHNGFNYTDKANGMSGWQRLGVVFSVVIALLIISMKYDSFPTQKQAYRVLTDRAQLWVSCEEYFGNMSGQEKAVEACGEYARQHKDEKLIAEVDMYKDRLNTLAERQVAFVAHYFAWWAGISLIIYLIAITIRWVYRGFCPKRV